MCWGYRTQISSFECAIVRTSCFLGGIILTRFPYIWTPLWILCHSSMQCPTYSCCYMVSLLIPPHLPFVRPLSSLKKLVFSTTGFWRSSGNPYWLMQHQVFSKTGLVVISALIFVFNSYILMFLSHHWRHLRYHIHDNGFQNINEGSGLNYSASQV